MSATEYSSLMSDRLGSSAAAMLAHPECRANEFHFPLMLANLQPGDVVVDLPAGKGYLKSFLDVDVQLIEVTTVEDFLPAGRDSRFPEKPRQAFSQVLELGPGIADAVLSIAGIHHIPDRSLFYQECWRILKPGGKLIIAEVLQNTPPAYFLNQAVDRYASSGHKGCFLSVDTLNELRECRFQACHHEHNQYPWRFVSEQQMTEFCRGVFCMDLANDSEVLQSLKQCCGYSRHAGEIHLNWELSCFYAEKPGQAD